MGTHHDRDLKPQQKHKGKDDPQGHSEQKLNGTFVSVLLLGGFIAVTWLAILFLYIDRA